MDDLEEESERISVDSGKEKAAPVKYHEECIEKIAEKLGKLVKQGRSTYTSADQSLRVLCIVSKEYQQANAKRYWYAFHPSQQEFLNEGEGSFIAFGCGAPDRIVPMPFADFQAVLPKMRKTEKDERFYWHVEIFNKSGQYFLYKATDEELT